MSVIEKIVAVKKKEIAERQELYPVKRLERSMYFDTPVVSLRKYLLRPDRQGIIAEIKRRSPSAGVLHAYVNVERTSIGYMQAGAAALSVLTDATFFGGSSEDLSTARRYNFCPILRKDFILDEYQIIESKSIGADAILLIARILDASLMKQLHACATSLGMEVMVELHDEDDVEKIPSDARLLGINHRNLQTFEVSLEKAIHLNERIGHDAIRIAESGIQYPEQVVRLRENGFDGFLIGEAFMRHARPDQACRDFIARLRALESAYAE